MPLDPSLVSTISQLPLTQQKTNSAIEVSQTASILDSVKVPLMYPVMDAKTWVLSATTAAPPGSPAENDRYLVPNGATGAWTGRQGYVAEWLLDGLGTGAWYYCQAQGLVFAQDSSIIYAVTMGTAAPMPLPLPVLVSKTANYTGDGDEDYIEVDCTAGVVEITLVPAAYANRRPVRVRRIDMTAGAGHRIDIYDGAEVVDSIVSPAGAFGKINGWRDVSAVGSSLRSEGIG